VCGVATLVSCLVCGCGEKCVGGLENLAVAGRPLSGADIDTDCLQVTFAEKVSMKQK